MAEVTINDLPVGTPVDADQIEVQRTAASGGLSYTTPISGLWEIASFEAKVEALIPAFTAAPLPNELPSDVPVDADRLAIQKTVGAGGAMYAPEIQDLWEVASFAPKVLTLIPPVTPPTPPNNLSVGIPADADKFELQRTPAAGGALYATPISNLWDVASFEAKVLDIIPAFPVTINQLPLGTPLDTDLTDLQKPIAAGGLAYASPLSGLWDTAGFTAKVLDVIPEINELPTDVPAGADRLGVQRTVATGGANYAIELNDLWEVASFTTKVIEVVPTINELPVNTPADLDRLALQRTVGTGGATYASEISDLWELASFETKVETLIPELSDPPLPNELPSDVAADADRIAIQRTPGTGGAMYSAEIQDLWEVASFAPKILTIVPPPVDPPTINELPTAAPASLDKFALQRTPGTGGLTYAAEVEDLWELSSFSTKVLDVVPTINELTSNTPADLDRVALQRTAGTGGATYSSEIQDLWDVPSFTTKVTAISPPAAGGFGGVYNVKPAAIGDGVHPVEDTNSFKAELAKITTSSAVVVVPETPPSGFQGYNLTENVIDSHGLRLTSLGGGVMQLDGRIFTTTTQVMISGFKIRGQTAADGSTPPGSIIRSTTSFPNDGTPIVRLGRAINTFGWTDPSVALEASKRDEPTDGTKLEWVSINGSGADAQVNNLTVGVLSSSCQERSGLENVIIKNVDVGFKAIVGTNINPGNFVIRNTDVWGVRRCGFSFEMAGGNQLIEKCTVSALGGWRTISNVTSNGAPNNIRVTTNTHGFTDGEQIHCGGIAGSLANTILLRNAMHAGTNGSGNAIWVVDVISTTIFDLVGSTFAGSYTEGGGRAKWLGVGFRHSGQAWSSLACHAEYLAYGMTVGEAPFWDFSGKVENFTGHNPPDYPPMAALVRIIAKPGNHIMNMRFENLGHSSLPNGVYMVQDDVNGIVIPWSQFFLRKYEFAGDYPHDSLVTAKRPVYTSFYDWLGASNIAVKGMVLNGTTTQDVDRGYPRGGNAGILQITGTAGGAAEEIRTISDPKTGDQVYFHFMSAVTIRNNAAAGTATERILTSTAADVSAAVNSYYRATYGDVRGAADRWYFEPV